VRRRWPWVLGVLAFLVIGAAAYLRLLGGGPVFVVPGGWLRGELVLEPVEDWSFAADEQYVDVESRARALPYSRTTWFMVHEGEIYLLLPSLFGDGLHQRIQEDPAVRIRLEGKVYPLVAVPFEGERKLAALLAPLLRRTMAVEISGRVRRVSRAEGQGLDAQVWIYRLDHPGSV
jgi:hypothetical protein